MKGEDKICTSCFVKLPVTNHHLDPNNALAKRFYGKIQIREANSFLNFVKEGLVQKLMHKLKYQGKQEVGELLGKWYGRVLKDNKINNYDLIIPVPMHKRKERKRGYNQADCIAKGFSDTINIPWNDKIIEKVTETESQTKKNRFSRWENTKEVFSFSNIKSVENLNLLLIDDVVTTGATLESCAKILLEDGKCKSVSVATIAIAV